MSSPAPTYGYPDSIQLFSAPPDNQVRYGISGGEAPRIMVRPEPVTIQPPQFRVVLAPVPVTLPPVKVELGVVHVQPPPVMVQPRPVMVHPGPITIQPPAVAMNLNYGFAISNDVSANYATQAQIDQGFGKYMILKSTSPTSPTMSNHVTQKQIGQGYGAYHYKW